MAGTRILAEDVAASLKLTRERKLKCHCGSKTFEIELNRRERLILTCTECGQYFTIRPAFDCYRND